MQVKNIPLAETGLMAKLTKHYLNNQPDTANLFQWPLGFEGISEAIKARENFKIDRNVLVESLQKQYNSIQDNFLAGSQLVAENIGLLKDENTFTVTTGHQLNIFTGPLYFIYKIVSTIKLAQQLKQKFSDKNFVPVYWMASEDHDFEEINHIYLWGKMLQWQAESKTAVGRLETKTLQPLIDEIKQILGTRENTNELIELLQNAYSNSKNLSQATRKLAHKLFKEYGLVILDADNAMLKQAFIPILEQDILENINFTEINKTIQNLEKEHKIQVKPREINVFYLDDEGRNRIVKEGEKYSVLNTNKSWNKQELLDELHKNPQNFSPNVVLRPMYQETILPNLAYIGGTNEIAYWLELKNAFEANNVFFPQLVVRDSALWVGKGAAKNLSVSKLNPEDMLLSFSEIKAKFYDNNEITHPAENELNNLIEAYEKLKKDAQGLPSDLVANMVKGINAHTKELKSWKGDVKKSVDAGQDKAIDKLQKTYNSLFPDGEFQERHDNFISLYCQYGRDFVKTLIENFDPLSAQLHIFIEE